MTDILTVSANPAQIGQSNLITGRGSIENNVVSLYLRNSFMLHEYNTGSMPTTIF